MPSKAKPLAPAAYAQWCRAHALAPSTCQYLSRIRGSQPVRHGTSRANNVSGAYPSRKMGFTIQFESQNPELWALVVMDRGESGNQNRYGFWSGSKRQSKACSITPWIRLSGRKSLPYGENV